MSQQPELTSPSLPASPGPIPGGVASSAQAPGGRGSVDAENIPQRIPRWLVRTELYLRVLLRMYIGLAICYAPWSHLFWDH